MMSMSDLRLLWAEIRLAKSDRDRIRARQVELAAQVEKLTTRLAAVEAVPAVRSHL